MVSIFTKVDRTSKPVSATNIETLLQQIKNPTYKEQILSARLVGKTTNPSVILFDMDQYSFLLNEKNTKLISELKQFTQIIFFSQIYDIKQEKNYPKELGVYCDWNNIIEKYQLKDLGFACPIWTNFTKTKQDATNKKGDFEIIVRNYYDYIKCTKTPVVTWNGLFGEQRMKPFLKELSGFIYMDVDDFTVLTKNQVRKILQDDALTFVKAVWDSFGGNGIGFLIAVDKLTIDNFKSTWITYSKKLQTDFNIKVDKATKDITRINVLSYDESIFIRDKVSPLEAVEMIESVFTIKTDGIIDELQPEVIQLLVDNLYTNIEYVNQSENRLTYNFYQTLFAKCNHYGIPMDNVFSILNNWKESYPMIFNNKKYNILDIKHIAERQYSAYADQFGTVEIEKGQYNISEDYVVVGLYKRYDGDEYLKMTDVLKNLKIKHADSNDINQMLVSFTIICKKIGLTFKSISKFIEDKFGYDVEQNILIKKTYFNAKYVFGLHLKLKNDVFLAKRKTFIERSLAEGKVQLKIEDVNSEVKLKEIYGYAKNTFKKIDNTTILDFVSFYFKESNSWGINMSMAIKYLIATCEFYNIERYANYYGNEIYEFESIKHGLKFIIPPSTDNKKKISSPKILDNDKKLSDLNLLLSAHSEIIWADTNMGKTTWACNGISGKKIILVPTIGALKSIENKYKASSYYEGNKNVSSDDTIIVCTYSSFPKLFNLIKSWGDKGKEYMLIVDEQHNFAVSSAKEYRNNELNFVLDNISFFEKSLYLTGTFFDIEHPVLNQIPVKRVKWKNQPIKNANIVYYTDKLFSIEKKLIKGQKNIIYLQDKKINKVLGKLVEYLKLRGWEGIYLLNADQKNEPHFKNLINNEMFENDAQVIITTSVAVEAINILNLDVATIHFMTFENPRLMEQMVNRMRLKLPEIFIYLKEQNKKIDNLSFNIVEEQRKLIGEGQRLLKYFATPKNKKNDTYSEVASQKLFANHIFEKSLLFRVKEHEWEIDYLCIANKVFNDETAFAKQNVNYLKFILSEYGWVFGEVEVDGEKMASTNKEFLAQKKQEFNEIVDKYTLAVFEDAKQEGHDFLKSIVENENKTVFDDKKFPDIEWNIRLKLLKLTKYMKFEESCKLLYRWIIDFNKSEEKFKVIMRQIAVQIAKQNGVFDSKVNFDSQFTNSVLKLYFQDKSSAKQNFYTKDEIIEFFNRRKRFHKLISEMDGEKMAFEVFRKYFEIKPKIENGVVKFYFGGLLVSNELTKFTKDFYNILLYYKENQVPLQTSDICKQINDLRKKLPFLSFFPVSEQETLKLIQDYATLKKTTIRQNRKTKSTYKISECEPFHIKDIEISINQEILIEPEDFQITKVEKNKNAKTKQISTKSIRGLSEYRR